MGTANFMYRDTLYARNDYDDDYDEYDEYDEYDYDSNREYEDTKYALIEDLDTIGKGKTIGTVYGIEDGDYLHDSRSFPGIVIGRVYKDFSIENEYALGSIDFTIGDDLCLRQGYYCGYNFDRVTPRYADYGTNELEIVKEALHDAIYKYDELRLAEEVEAENLTEEEVQEIKDTLYAKTLADVEAFIAEADNVYHSLGEKHFDHYREIGRFSNGEAVYQRA